MVQINNKFKILIFLLCVIVLISTVTSTYARYASATEGVVTTDFARWQIFVNSQNITENYGTSMTFTPTILPNENVAANKIAPSSKGYFDIAINPTNVDVSFIYDIAFSIPEDSLITDIKLTDYAIVEGNEITEEATITKIPLEDLTSISDKMLYDNNTENFSFQPFVIRAFFSWVDDETGGMSDEQDSIVGDMVADAENFNFELGVSINFKQYTGIDDDNEVEDSQEPDDNSGTDDGEEINP